LSRDRGANLPRPADGVETDDGQLLPTITDKQYAFIQSMLAGNNQSDAYREAYDASEMTNPTIWARASELRHTSKVSAWLDYLMKEANADMTCSFDAHMRELNRLKNMAETKGIMNTAVQAEHYRGKAAGHYTDKVEIRGGDKESSDVFDDLKQEFGEDIAHRIMTRKGLSHLTH